MDNHATMIIRKIFIIIMENNTEEAMTYQQRYCEKSKEKCLEKGRKYYEVNKEKLKNDS